MVTDGKKLVAQESSAAQPETERTAVEKTTASVTNGSTLQFPKDSAAVAQEMVNQPEVAIQPPMEPRKVVLPLQANSTRLTKAARRSLERFLVKFAEYPRATLMVKGFVSSKSNSPENIRLSEERAEALTKLLEKKGIDPERIELKGMGNQEPIASNDTYEGRRQNRRVEIVVVDDGTRQ